jgi:hypothetical protein
MRWDLGLRGVVDYWRAADRKVTGKDGLVGNSAGRPSIQDHTLVAYIK